MRKIFLLLFILLPGICNAQEYLSNKLAENRIDEATNDTIKRTYWQVLERGGISRKLNTFYRISNINNHLFIDLKIIEGGSAFVVARNAELRIVLENSKILILYNTVYQVSCPGCGARGYGGSGAQGVMLSFPVDNSTVRELLRNYIAKVGINTGEDYLEKKVNETHSELFIDELKLAYSNK